MNRLNFVNNQVKLSPATQDETHYIAKKIDEFNAQKVPFTQAEPLIHINYVLKNNSGRVIGGITATLYYWNVLFINILWIDEQFRSHGYGSQLLHLVETEAKKKGCSLASLDTFDFQAKDFYLKHGYEVFGVLDDCPPGHKKYFMKKNL